ncbi:hypothetical protein SAMN02745150_00729 [Brevinema andersonii]|uniref:Uncharacterized protein n=1 Tax=Brevinema andersonii TaxID=34097 RepID=A0A1I1DQL0_BREAD|nr:hypothetical protein [Brevinema andersonii]SFB77124.1 hypothetical protein SAMN02745150_00729 [Brevinema andersonii]
MEQLILYKLLFLLLFVCQISYAETMIGQELKVLDGNFKKSLQATAKMLPFAVGKNVISSNISYSFDSINGRIHYEALIEYSFRYGACFDVMNTLVYSQEEAEYYFSFIQGASIFLDSNSDMELISFTNNQNVERYLWQKSENTAYYVPVGSQKNSYLIFKIQLVPRQKGVLLKYKQVVEDIVKRTKWNQVLDELI